GGGRPAVAVVEPAGRRPGPGAPAGRSRRGGSDPAALGGRGTDDGRGARAELLPDGADGAGAVVVRRTRPPGRPGPGLRVAETAGEAGHGHEPVMVEEVLRFLGG